MRRRRRVKIVATLGPASHAPHLICHLCEAGVDVFRINMSHTDHASLADFVPACRRIFGDDVRILDGSRAILVGDVKLSLENGERELWLVEMRGPLEHWRGMVELDDGLELALRKAKEVLDG